MKFCDRCYEEYEDDEIVQFDKESPRWICLPCKCEFDNRLKLFLIEFFNDQPERSKREDSSCCKQYYVEYATEWRIPNGYENIKPDGMRCSEHCGDTMRPAEKIWPA